MWFTIGKSSFSLTSAAINAQDDISLINIMRTKVQFQGTKLTIGELIAMSSYDEEKRKLSESQIIQILDKTYDSCSVFCINNRQIRSMNCKTTLTEIIGCSKAGTIIPTFNNEKIIVSLSSNVQAPKPIK